MKPLSEILIDVSETDDTILNDDYREPAIITYNRIEPRPRTEDFTRTLRAEVRDALWMLTRQWQMGELEAQDAGSAIDTRLLTSLSNIDRIALEGVNGNAYDEMVPMETFVEREKLSFSYILKVQAGQYLLKLHSASLKTKYLVKYMAVYTFPDLGEQFSGQAEGLNFYVATKSRSLDGEKIYADIQDNTFKTKIGMDAGDETDIDNIIDQFKKWLQRQYSQPASANDSAWHSQQLDYQFSVATPASGAVLEASQYYQGRLDWYAFDNVLNPSFIEKDGPDGIAGKKEKEVLSFLPTPVTFKGAPNPRFWEMEERQLNFGMLNAKTTDQLMLVFAEYGLIYGNDWFVIPYKMEVNTLCEIAGLVVTDVFGDRTLIRAADDGEDNNWQRWSMFNLSNKDDMGSYNKKFFLPATLTGTIEGDPIEQVNFMRDEMANMVWGVEDIIPDATGKGIDGYEATDKTAVELPPVDPSDAKIRYVFGTTVPENWIPFLPVHKPGSNHDIYFQRAAMPKMGVPPKEVIKAKGVLLNEVASPYYINEEEISNAGTIVKRTYQRTRWYNGKTYLWIGRSRETGKGEGNSNLSFDQAKNIG